MDTFQYAVVAALLQTASYIYAYSAFDMLYACMYIYIHYNDAFHYSRRINIGIICIICWCIYTKANHTYNTWQSILKHKMHHMYLCSWYIASIIPLGVLFSLSASNMWIHLRVSRNWQFCCSRDSREILDTKISHYSNYCKI